MSVFLTIFWIGFTKTPFVLNYLHSNGCIRKYGYYNYFKNHRYRLVIRTNTKRPYGRTLPYCRYERTCEITFVNRLSIRPTSGVSRIRDDETGIAPKDTHRHTHIPTHVRTPLTDPLKGWDDRKQRTIYS